MPIPFVDTPPPSLTTAQMIEVDRAMIEDYGIVLMQMMENAGRALATLARERFLGGDPRGRRVTVLAGTGGNGGGALVCARRLHGWGAVVEVLLTAEDARFTSVPAHQLAIVRHLGLAVRRRSALEEVAAPALVIDGLIGYSLRGDPREDAAALIDWANAAAAPVLALDAPSGVDTTSGTIHDPAIRAAATMTLALPKRGLLEPGLGETVGELYLADIGVPPSLYAGPGLELQVEPLFATSDIVRLR
ncbi:MAG: NAD(P)H-hydrate epimerase [Deltaproteobacteria bacterium]|nr:NAD(P)H-hydrate epimerase [Deltaproteobacteria bacterium]